MIGQHTRHNHCVLFSLLLSLSLSLSHHHSSIHENTFSSLSPLLSSLLFSPPTHTHPTLGVEHPIDAVHLRSKYHGQEEGAKKIDMYCIVCTGSCVLYHVPWYHVSLRLYTQVVCTGSCVLYHVCHGVSCIMRWCLFDCDSSP